MNWESNWYLRFIFLVTTVSADLCPVPEIRNGRLLIDGAKQEDYLFGEVLCNPGFHLVGESKTLKCRVGIWSQRDVPMCAMDTCPDLPQLHNGRNIKVRNSAGSAFHFKCKKGYKRYGVRNTHCEGGAWSHRDNWPICTKDTCDKSGMFDIPYGKGKSLMHGAVFKYRCNPGTVMEGRNTVACTGRFWNGSVPSCNVGPSKPKLEFKVAGVPVENVKAGDWVEVSCRARGGNPLPDIRLTMDNEVKSSVEFMQFKNSFAFLATTDYDGKMVECDAVNKISQENAESRITVLSPPTQLKVSGPATIHHNTNYTYTCTVMDGNPAPRISWIVDGEEMIGDDIDSHVSQLQVVTAESIVSRITCQAENSEGVMSDSVHVNTEYLPQSIRILAPTHLTRGEVAHVTCILSESSPAPSITWTLEKFGEAHEVVEKLDETSQDTLLDGYHHVNAEFEMDNDEKLTHAIISCAAHLEGLGSVQSNIMNITIEDPEIEEVFEYESDEDGNSQKKDSDTDLFHDYKMDAALFENENSTEDFYNYEDESLNSNHLDDIETSEDAVDKIDDDKMQSESATENNISSLKDDSQFLEVEFDKDGNKVDSQEMNEHINDESKEFIESERLSSAKIMRGPDDENDEDNEVDSSERQIVWIPYDREQDIQEYQDNFSPRYQDYQDAVREEAEFLQADVLQEPESGRLTQDNLDSASVVMNDPSPKFMASFSSGNMISINNFNIVRSCLLICLIKRFWM